MKKIIVTLAAMAIAVSSFAQASIGAGYLNHSMSNSDGSATNGFYVGGDFNINLAGGLGLAPGIYYSYTSASESSELLGGSQTEHYVSIPVMFNYSFNVVPGLKFFAFAGPTARYGIASTVKLSALGQSASFDAYEEMEDYNRAAILIGGGIGADVLDKIRVSVGYDYGLTNRFQDCDTNYNDQLLHIGVAFLF